MTTHAQGFSCPDVARIFEGDRLALGYDHVGDLCDGAAHTRKYEHLIGLGHMPRYLRTWSTTWMRNR